MTENDMRKKAASALDRSFPSVWLFSGAILLVIVLTVLSGWKIINLEHERNQIIFENRLLEQKVQSHSEILKQLPLLESRQNNLKVQVDDLEGKLKAARAEKDSMQIQASEAAERHAKANSQRQIDEEAANAARKELANLQSEIMNARNQSGNLETTVQALMVQEKSLRGNINELNNQKSGLQADITGLEKEKINKKKILDSMALETSELQRIHLKFVTIAEKLETAKNVTENTIQKLQFQSGSLENTLTEIKNQKQVLGQEYQNIKNSVSEFKSATDSTNKAASELKSSSTSLSQTTEVLKRIIMETEGSIKEQLSGVRQATEKFDLQTAELNKILDEAKKNNVDISYQIKSLSGNVSSIGISLASFDKNIGVSEKATASYLEMTSKAQEIVKSLDSIQKNLENAADTLKQVSAKTSEQMNEQMHEQTDSLNKTLKLVEDRFNNLLTRMDTLKNGIEGSDGSDKTNN